MSLDVILKDDDGNELFSSNITHNLNKMAMEAGIYQHLWRPEEIGITKAHQLIEPLSKGFALVVGDHKRFSKFDAENNWGVWTDFVMWLAEYLIACSKNPNANVSVSR